MENHGDINRIFWVLQLKIITKTKLHKQPYSQLQLQVATVIGSLMDNFFVSNQIYFEDLFAC